MNESELSFYTKASVLGFKVLRNGYPDFAIDGPNGPFFVEVKQEPDVLNPNQRDMITFLAKAGFPTYLTNGIEFTKLDNPIVPVNERMPRCDLCPINIKWEHMKNKLNEELDRKYRTKWESVRAHAVTSYIKKHESWENSTKNYDKLLRNTATKLFLLSKIIASLFNIIESEIIDEEYKSIIDALQQISNISIPEVPKW